MHENGSLVGPNRAGETPNQALEIDHVLRVYQDALDTGLDPKQFHTMWIKQKAQMKQAETKRSLDLKQFKDSKEAKHATRVASSQASASQDTRGAQIDPKQSQALEQRKPYATFGRVGSDREWVEATPPGSRAPSPRGDAPMDGYAGSIFIDDAAGMASEQMQAQGSTSPAASFAAHAKLVKGLATGRPQKGLSQPSSVYAQSSGGQSSGSGQQGAQPPQALYPPPNFKQAQGKTSRCFFMANYGQCKYGKACKYAHDRSELAGSLAYPHEDPQIEQSLIPRGTV